MHDEDQSFDRSLKTEESFQSPKSSCQQRSSPFSASNLSSNTSCYMQAPSSSSSGNGTSGSKYPASQSRFNDSFPDLQLSRYPINNSSVANNNNRNFNGHRSGDEVSNPGSTYGRMNDLSLDIGPYTLSDLLSNSHHEQVSEAVEVIPERFRQTSAAEDSPQPVITNSHLHHLLTGDTASYMRSTYQQAAAAAAASSFDDFPAISSTSSSCNNVSMPSSVFHHANDSYLEALELEISLQVANRVVGNRVSLPGGYG